MARPSAPVAMHQVAPATRAHLPGPGDSTHDHHLRPARLEHRPLRGLHLRQPRPGRQLHRVTGGDIRPVHRTRQRSWRATIRGEPAGHLPGTLDNGLARRALVHLEAEFVEHERGEPARLLVRCRRGAPARIGSVGESSPATRLLSDTNDSVRLSAEQGLRRVDTKPRATVARGIGPSASLGLATAGLPFGPTDEGPRVPKHSMCEDLLVSCADNHVVCEASAGEQGGP
jgi:hypothetical protein